MANDVVIHVRAKDDASKVIMSSSAKMGDSLKKLGGVAIVAGTVLAGALVKGAVKAVSAASDLNETMNKSSVIFGKSHKEIEKWASGAAKNLGLSKQQAMESAASFGDMFLQLGFAQGSAVKMSKSVVQLAADLGSFNNLDTADVQERIAAAFRGEYDSLQALVPTINAAKVEQVALATTGKKTADALTAQDKAAAVLKITMESTKRAHGDFAKTQDGLANSIKIARARLDDFAASAGKALLPFVQKGMKGFNIFLDRLEDSGALTGAIQDLGIALDEAFDAQKIEDTADALVLVVEAFAAVSKTMGKFDKVNGRAFTTFGVNVGLLGDAFTYWKAKAIAAMDDVATGMEKLGLLPKRVANMFHRMREDAEKDLDGLAKTAAAKKIETKLRADKRDAQAKIKDIDRQLKKTNDAKVISKLRGDKRDAQAAIRSITAQLNRLHGKEAVVWIRTNRMTYYGTSGVPTNPKGDGPRASGGYIGGQHAAGGGMRGGQVLVGEQGPEIVDLPLGSHVNSNPDSQRMAAGGRRGGDTHFHFHGPVYGDHNALRRALVDMKRSGQLDVVVR